MPDFIYKIEPIIPVERGPFRMWLVGADLDYGFALKARGTEMPAETLNRFHELGTDITKKFGLGEFGTPPYHFVKGSWLLHYCTVLGNACGLGLEHNAQQDFLENFERIKQQNPLEGFPISYTPHNVDTKEQALCLLSLWLEWANLTKSVFDFQKI